jgi:hypothetical protein
MVRRLLRAATAYGGLLGGGTVALLYVISLATGIVFGRWAVLLAAVGFIVGPLLFAQAGSSPGTAAGVGTSADDDGGGLTALDETSARTFAFVDTPPRAALGLYLLGVGLFAVVGLLTVA